MEDCKMTNSEFNFDVADELRKIRGMNNQDGISKISRISKVPQTNSIYSAEDTLKIAEIKQLIRSYAKHWEENEEFINKYIDDQLKTYPLNELLSCFRL